MFFHHLNLADAKSWSHPWMTGSYVIYALAVVLTSLAVGPAIDRFGAARFDRASATRGGGPLQERRVIDALIAAAMVHAQASMTPIVEAVPMVAFL